jgi:hypothetical protein
MQRHGTIAPQDKRWTVPEAENAKRYALECLRLQADCWQLAAAAADPALRSHFERMAAFWGSFPDSGAGTIEPKGSSPDDESKVIH